MQGGLRWTVSPLAVDPQSLQKCAIASRRNPCQRFKAFLRRCWAPLPSSGGAPCSSKGVPIAFGQPCALCPAVDLSSKNCTAERKQILANVDDNCLGYFKDFLPCCSKNFDEPGFCTAGHCIQKPIV